MLQSRRVPNAGFASVPKVLPIVGTLMAINADTAFVALHEAAIDVGRRAFARPGCLDCTARLLQTRALTFHVSAFDLEGFSDIGADVGAIIWTRRA